MTPSDVGAETAGVRRAWGWTAALRAGEVTPWSRWRAHDDGDGEPSGPVLPGAQQLELLRRLNRVADAVPPALADRVLAADAPGRGRTDLPLLGAGAPPRFGPPAVDPGELRDDELTRLAAGLLAEDLAATAPPERATSRRRPWAPSYRLDGDDWLAQPLRADLRRRGRPEREHPDLAYVLATDLATMLGHAWTSRAFAESGSGWTSWLAGFVEHDRLPHRADPLGPLRAWAGRLGVDRTVLVLDPALLPVRLRGRRRPARPPAVTAAGVDLARRVSTTLGILVPAERRTALLREVLLPRLPVDPAATVALPARWHGWVHDHADRLRRAVAADGYPVLGDPARLLPGDSGDGRDPDPTEVLGLALRLLLDPVTPRAEEDR